MSHVIVCKPAVIAALTTAARIAIAKRIVTWRVIIGCGGFGNVTQDVPLAADACTQDVVNAALRAAAQRRDLPTYTPAATWRAWKVAS